MAVLGLLVALVLFDSYVVPSSAMEPTIEPGARVLARSIDGDDVSRGDLVVFRPPEGAPDPQVLRVSRVVAVGGDEIAPSRDGISVNGKLVDEPYVAPGIHNGGLDRTVVPEGHVFVMGDNRQASQDSRVYGAVPNGNIEKLVVAQWWPLSGVGGF
jgi:signal peptidase I